MGRRLEKTIRWRKTFSARVVVTLGGVLVPEVILRFASLHSPKDRFTLTHVQGTLGIADDPIDERPEWAIVQIADDGDPSGVNLADAGWKFSQNWRTLGTPGQVINTNSEIDDDDVNVELATSAAVPGQRLALVAESNTGSQLFNNLVIEGEYVARQFRTPGKMSKVLRAAAMQ